MVNGMLYGMTLRMDKSGRIVFPQPLRKRLGFKLDMELEVVEERGGVLLRPTEQQPSMIQVDGLWVHQGTVEHGANWGRVLDDVREERIESVLKA
jgi:bifunctional DNA-binding transcriptional regulator/antitoxin component of YhaV-PrlF toxin-antitoxin module